MCGMWSLIAANPSNHKNIALRSPTFPLEASCPFSNSPQSPPRPTVTLSTICSKFPRDGSQARAAGSLEKLYRARFQGSSCQKAAKQYVPPGGAEIFNIQAEEFMPRVTRPYVSASEFRAEKRSPLEVPHKVPFSPPSAL